MPKTVSKKKTLSPKLKSASKKVSKKKVSPKAASKNTKTVTVYKDQKDFFKLDEHYKNM